MKRELEVLQNELSCTFAVDTLAHDYAKENKPFDADDILQLAQAYICLREKAYLLVTELTKK